MTTDTTLKPDPRIHPDNANIPAINLPPTLLGTTISFLLLAVLAICLRLWVRIRDSLWGWDDAFVALAGITSVIGDIIVCLMPQDGLGLHLWTLDPPHLMSYFKHVYMTNSTYCASATLIKLSILFQYLRLFAETAASNPTKYRLACRLTWSLIILNTVWGLTFLCLALFSCNPITKNWNAALAGRCIGFGSKDPDEFFVVFMGHSVSNSVLDLLVLALPIPFLSMMRLAGKSRVGLITLFTLGCIVGTMAVSRMIALSLNRAGTVPVIDMTYHTPAVYIFGVLEVNIAIIAASIPIFWPVIYTLAANKIFVVNEIEIHVEHAPRDSLESGSAIGLADRKDSYGGRSSRLSITTKSHEGKSTKLQKVLPRSLHRQKNSNTSSLGRSMGRDFGCRPSTDSQRNLCRTVSHEVGSKGSLTRSERDEWLHEVDKVNVGGGNTTTVERTKIPFEHIKAFDNQ